MGNSLGIPHSCGLVELVLLDQSNYHQAVENVKAPLSLGYSRQEYWSGWPFSSPGVLPDPGIIPRSPILQADSLLSEPQGTTAIHRYIFIFFSIMFFHSILNTVPCAKMAILP